MPNKKYLVGFNQPGYLPTAEPHEVEGGFEEAWAEFIGLLQGADVAQEEIEAIEALKDRARELLARYGTFHELAEAPEGVYEFWVRELEG